MTLRKRLGGVMRELLTTAAAMAADYLEDVDDRRVVPETLEGLDGLAGPLPAHGQTADELLAELNRIAAPATIASAGPRYFGFVTGGALPVTVAANWLAAAWDQNSFSKISSPLAAAVEQAALPWLNRIFGFPETAAGAFVTGATMANFTALAAARHRVLADMGWDVAADGLFGAPPITVLVGEEVHTALLKALRMLGLGEKRVVRLPVDGQGRIRPDALPPIEGPTILCLQAGNVNSGGFDPADALIPPAQAAGAWVHTDGAFGIWAKAAPQRAYLAAGYEAADSLAVDGHKWLNVPYDSGFTLVRDEDALRDAMSMSAAYLIGQSDRDPGDFTPECSRRMRGLEVWVALKHLGRDGLADLVERCCRHAERFAEGLTELGFEILNDVELNQVVAHYRDDDTTRAVLAAVQDDGTCWCGGTNWRGKDAIRLSVSSWATTADDIDRSLAAFRRAIDSVVNRS